MLSFLVVKCRRDESFECLIQFEFKVSDTVANFIFEDTATFLPAEKKKGSEEEGLDCVCDGRKCQNLNYDIHTCGSCLTPSCFIKCEMTSTLKIR